MQIWGITGMMGAGKSLALEFIDENGLVCLSADQVSRFVVDKTTIAGRELIANIQQTLGGELLTAEGALDRDKLRDIVSNSSEKKAQLEDIMLPAIRAYIANWIEEQKKAEENCVFIEGTRFSPESVEDFDGVLFINSTEELRLQRIAKREDVTIEEAKKLSSMLDELQLREVSSEEIINDGDVESFQKHIISFLSKHGLCHL